MTIPFQRSSGNARARRSKTMLLPIPRATADGLALQVHLALSALRGGYATGNDAQTLLQTQVLVLSIVNAGYGELTPEEASRADDALLACFERGGREGAWRLDDEAFDALARIVTVYDGQLRSAPLWVLTDASERLDRIGAGENAQRKQA
ncbi:hypothetical protein [Paraburkholderia caballeronis]|uniref:Fis family transcriptional regulator n=2 Tax=Paraburkholderia caballeronis TaxID=416943 RepID=A0A1H7VTM0_9BURK|nr:hypothetical protein C7403_1253 [Paraburkholderia caballeronis]PXW93725.1 hypothetical protein C7407_1253 [Paraburkholderia caballeronis]RAJ88965.1 hypothetical protein C7409_1253 [Paraburkholderia caballeronis]TDV05129.1 hypothetical protein C7408_12761 [Paraburkholderia caballeronis]TDV08176.1 hypothetical protein C7406_1303 [Paraburkholderia caballeronis]